MSKVIGIDLGTSNSAAAYMEAGKPTIIPAAEGVTAGGKAFPSYVAFTKDGQLLVGEPARRQAVSNPEGTITTFKRKMGQDFKYKIHGKEYTPQQLSAFILQKIKNDAEAFLGTKVEKAVVTVPAYFNDNQRQATKDAGTIAGLEVVRIINEPTAACLAYGLDKGGSEEKIMVFDFGGGTLDVTIMNFWKEGGFNVISTSGDTQLGGTDMDNSMVDHIALQFKRESGIDLRQDKMALQRLREAAEKAKIELSNILETDINLPFITADASGPKHLTMKFGRATLESIVRPIVDRCAVSIDQSLADAKISATDITRVILVGGPTRMPIVQKFVEEHAGKKVERGVDPMECVALGASIQAAIIVGDVKDIVLLDVIPLSLGLETLGSVMTKLIDRNTTIPTKKSQIFSTAADNQTSVEVHVLQGERPMASDNTSLGRFMLDGIPTAPRGVPQIEVGFDIDENGILHVSAKDLGTGKEQHITISAPNKLSKDEIDKMVKQAESFADQDKQRKETIEAKNELDNLVYHTEKTMKEHGDKISQDERLAVERAISEAKEAVKSDDAARITKSRDELIKASHKLAEFLYKDASKKQGTEGPASQGGTRPVDGSGEPPKEESKDKDKEGKRDDVIDAEFKENK
ncbi:MAG: molecular chaperone DnaK [Elusimicrobia bacterium]|nr:molecular chaperone DnaK [Elusimicrobiota bacterium]